MAVVQFYYPSSLGEFNKGCSPPHGEERLGSFHYHYFVRFLFLRSGQTWPSQLSRCYKHLTLFVFYCRRRSYTAAQVLTHLCCPNSRLPRLPLSPSGVAQAPVPHTLLRVATLVAEGRLGCGPSTCNGYCGDLWSWRSAGQCRPISPCIPTCYSEHRLG